MSTLKIIRYSAFAGIAILAILVGLAVTGVLRPGSTGVVLNTVPAVGGPFTLVDHTGAEVTEKSLLGKPTAMFFGFTFCPDVCPTTLVEMQDWIGKLGADADKLNYVFVSVDPERDTPEVLASYLSSFDPRIRGFTGSPDNVAEMIKVYRVFAQKVEREDGDYTMNHSASVFLFDADGRFTGTIAYGEDAENAIAKLRRLLDDAPETS